MRDHTEVYIKTVFLANNRISKSATSTFTTSRKSDKVISPVEIEDFCGFYFHNARHQYVVSTETSTRRTDGRMDERMQFRHK